MCAHVRYRDMRAHNKPASLFRGINMPRRDLTLKQKIDLLEKFDEESKSAKKEKWLRA